MVPAGPAPPPCVGARHPRSSCCATGRFDAGQRHAHGRWRARALGKACGGNRRWRVGAKPGQAASTPHRGEDTGSGVRERALGCNAPSTQHVPGALRRERAQRGLAPGARSAATEGLADVGRSCAGVMLGATLPDCGLRGTGEPLCAESGRHSALAPRQRGHRRHSTHRHKGTACCMLRCTHRGCTRGSAAADRGTTPLLGEPRRDAATRPPALLQ